MPITEDKLIKYRLTKSLEFFTRYFFKEFNGRKFVLNGHHVEMIDILEDVINGKITKLIINIAPRYSKTELAVKNLIAFCLALNSSARFIHLSYSDTLALDNSEEIKDFVQSEEYQRFFDVQIKKDSKSKKKWYTTNGGGVYATSAGGQVTGFGAGKVDDEDEEEADIDEFLTFINNAKGFGGAIIIDDPIKPDDTESDLKREKINYRFDSTIRSRVNSRNTPIIVIMQRLHPMDLSGYLLDIEPDEWTVLSIPCIKEDGAALWEFKHTLDELEHLRTVNASVFESQYLQNPSPKEGLLFHRDDLNYFEDSDIDLSTKEACCGFIDVAGEGEDNHCLPFGDLIENRVYITDAVFTKEGTDVNIPETVRRINLKTPEYVQIESNFGGGMYTKLLTTSADPKMNGITALIDIRAGANKHTRILTMAGFIKTHFYFKRNFDKSTEYGRFMNNLVEYLKTGGNKHDDAPDALAGLARMILNYFPHLWENFVDALQRTE